MPRLPYLFRTTTHLALDAFILLRSNLRSRTVLAAENLFLRKQLALYRERHVKPRRANPATRAALVLLACVIDWKPVLTVVRPDTLIRWVEGGARPNAMRPSSTDGSPRRGHRDSQRLAPRISLGTRGRVIGAMPYIVFAEDRQATHRFNLSRSDSEDRR